MHQKSNSGFSHILLVVLVAVLFGTYLLLFSSKDTFPSRQNNVSHSISTKSEMVDTSVESVVQKELENIVVDALQDESKREDLTPTAENPIWLLPVETEKYGDHEIGAFFDENEVSFIESKLLIAPVYNDAPVFPQDTSETIISYINSQYTHNSYFEVINNLLFVISTKGDFIYIYKLNFDNPKKDSPYSVELVDTIPGPRYDVGSPYSLICNSNTCNILSAFHFESGCSMYVNIETKVYGDLQCLGYTGDEVTPKALD